MPLPVMLKDVIEAMEPFGDEWQAYINRKTGELVCFTGEQAGLVERGATDVPEWMEEDVPKIREALSSEDYVSLPGSFEFHEYSVMQRFCLSLEQPERREMLLDAIRGSGAFRRFKDHIHVEGIEDRWYGYRDQALKELAVEFLEDEGIAYIDG